MSRVSTQFFRCAQYTVVGWVLAMAPVAVPAEGVRPDSAANQIQGLVTAVGKDMLQVNSKPVQVPADVVIENQDGIPMDFADIVLDAEVIMYMKRERVEKIVVTLPR